MVVGPVLAGYVSSRFVPGLARWMQTWGPAIANLVILWVIAVVVGVNRGRLSAEPLRPAMVLALAAVNGLGYLAGYAGGWLWGMPEPMRRALTIEIGMQNAGLGTTLALGLFPDRPAAAIPPALYAVGCMLTGTLLARFWSSRAPRGA
jgi:BASS family bile acid:Na+ symporter